MKKSLSSEVHVMNRHLAVILLVCVICAGCSKRPKGVISDGEMVQVMADMEMAEGYLQAHGDYNTSNADRENLIQSILDKHGITREEFDSTMTWYGRNPDIYSKLYVKADRELAKRQKRLTGGGDEVSYSDLWQYSRHVLISQMSSSDNLSFCFNPDQIGKGEKLVWKMRMNSMADGKVILGVTYTNGESSYQYRTIGSERNIEMTLQTDTGRTVRTVFGSLIPRDLNRRHLLIDSISLQAMPYDSIEYYRIHSQRHYSGPRLKVIQKAKPDSIDNTGNVENR